MQQVGRFMDKGNRGINKNMIEDILIILFFVIIPLLIILLWGYNNIRLNEHDVLLVYPVFTEQAYQENGWYDNTEHTTVYINNELDDRMRYGAGKHLLSYFYNEFDTVSDIAVTTNPELLQSYQTIVLLHNEYVTVEEYNAIMNHSNVIYLFPNSLYRYVEYNDKQITLLNQTGNPMGYSNTKYTNEFDDCITYEIVEYQNGKGLSCYPKWFELMFNPFLREDIRRMTFD